MSTLLRCITRTGRSRSPRRLVPRRVRGVLIFAALAALAAPAAAQRVLLFEDFESATPDLPANEAVASLGSFTRSEVLPNDPGTITVTGGQFPDPFSAGSFAAADFNSDGAVDGRDLLIWQRGFAPGVTGAAKAQGDANADGIVDGADLSAWGSAFGTAGGGGGNKSLLLYNPNSAVQQGANWFNIFPDDPSDPHFYFKNGTIEFDAYLEQVPANGYWSFLEIRLGFEFTGEDKGQVTTEGDQNIWNSFRMQEGGIAENPTNTFFDQVNTTFNGDGSVLLIDQAIRVRYEIDGVNAEYSVYMDTLGDETPEVLVIDGAPWTKIFNFNTFQNEPAPGINEISFMTDASARGIGSQAAGNVYIDNLRVVDFDQAPAGMAATGAVPEPTAWLLGCVALSGGLLVRRRR